MRICPICQTKYQTGDEFCIKDGARLVPIGSVDESSDDAGNPDAREDPDTASTDESTRRELQRLRLELTQRDGRIAELEEELAVARREFQELQAPPTEVPSAKTKEKAIVKQPGKKPGKKKSGSAVDPTDIVPPPAGAFGWLVCVGGPLTGQRFAITAEGLTIGRNKKYSEAGGISVPHEHVSNPHAWIGPDKNQIIVKDDGSTNGTYVNDPDSEPITKAVLAPGNTVIIAELSAGEFVYRK
jgi:hypothetical protein